MGIGDAFLMAFTSDHWLSWSTYFGGAEDHPNAHADCIRTLALQDPYRLYAAGYTDAAYDQGEFFPLHDPGYGAWPDQALAPETDGFVASFCIGGIFTDIGERPIGSSRPTIFFNGTGWRVADLASGQHEFMIYDALGKAVRQGTIHGGADAFIPAFGLAVGTYMIRLDAYAPQHAPLIR